MSNWDRQRLLSLFAQVDGLDLLEGALKKRKGVLLLLPHLEILKSLRCMASYYSFVALYNPPKVKYLERAVSNMRRHGGYVPYRLCGIKGYN